MPSATRAGIRRIADATDLVGNLAEEEFFGYAIKWDGTSFVLGDFEAAGAADLAIGNHVGAADPHTQYALDSALGTMATATEANYLLASGSRAGAVAGLQAFTSGIVTGIVRPATNSTTAVRVQNADGSSDVLTVDTTNRNLRITSPAVANRDIGPSQFSIVDTAATPVARFSATHDAGASRLQLLSPDGTKLFRMEAQNTDCRFAVPVGGVSFVGSGASGTIDFAAGDTYLRLTSSTVTILSGSADTVRLAVRGSITIRVVQR